MVLTDYAICAHTNQIFAYSIHCISIPNLYTMTSSPLHITILLGLFALMLAWFGNPIFIPDSYEQIILAECWATGSSTRINCDDIFPWFRPPLPSLMTAMWLQWVDGFSAMLLLSWGAMVGTVSVLTHRIYQTHVHEEHAIALVSLVVVCLALAGLLLNLGLLADSKVIVLPFDFGALSLLMTSKLTGFRALSIGILLGLSFLTRFENLLLIATGSILILWFSQRRIFNFVMY